MYQSHPVYKIVVLVGTWHWCCRRGEAIPTCSSFGKCLKNKSRVDQILMSEIVLTNFFIFCCASTKSKVIVTQGLNALASFRLLIIWEKEQIWSAQRINPRWALWVLNQQKCAWVEVGNRDWLATLANLITRILTTSLYIICWIKNVCPYKGNTHARKT